MQNESNHLKPCRLLVTGAAGQLGNEVRKCFSGDGAFDIDYMDRSSLDITDAAAVRKTISERDYDFIVNCAAYTAVDKAESERELCRRINVDGPSNIAAATKGTKTRIMHISTDYVFDGNSSIPYREDSVPNPLSFYGLTKLEGEKKLLSMAPDSIILRTGWLYSAEGHNFLRTILNKALKGDSLTVVDDQTGSPTYAADLVAVIKKILTSDARLSGIFNCTNEGQTTWFGFANEILKAANIGGSVKPCSSADYPTAAVRPRFSVLDKTKIKEALRLEIPSWQDALKRCVAETDTKTLK